jgi:hypothetical protein
MPQHRLGGASQKYMFDAAMTVGGHDDHLCLDLIGIRNDFVCGLAD